MPVTTRGRWTSGTLVLLCAVLSSGCSLIEKWIAGDTWQMPRVIQVKGIEGLCYHPPTWCATARAGRPVGILARDGDLFMSGKDGYFFPYRGTDGESLVLEEKDDVLLLNGKAVSVMLSEKGWEWLRKASIEDMASLRLLAIKKESDALDFGLLGKLAAVRPDIALYLENLKTPDSAARVVSLFEPRFLVIQLDVLAARFDVLEPRLTKLEVLWALGKGPSLDFMPRLPRLHTLLLGDLELAISGGIPGGSRNLRSVTLWGVKGAEDLSFLRNVTKLQELVLWNVDKLKDITALAAFADLKKLNFGGTERALDLSVLEQLPRLAWLGFPLNTTQDEFARVIASHPGLEVVELRSEKVTDLSPLRSLPHLKAAILLQKNVDVGPLQDLKNLQYLALPKTAFEGDAAKKTEALEKALPNTFVTQAGPYCLGSGWILLLVPAIVLLRGLRSRGYGPRASAHA